MQKTKQCKYCKEEFPKNGSHWFTLKDGTTRCKKQIAQELLRPAGPPVIDKTPARTYK